MQGILKKILIESREAEEQKIWALMQQVGVVGGWGLKRTKADSLNMESGMWRFTFRIEPKGAKLKDVISDMGPNYQGVSSSRSYLLKLLTGRVPIEDRKTRSELDKAQKIFYKAQRPLIDSLENKLAALDPIFNPIGFAYSGGGDTLWEMFIDDMDMQKFDPDYFDKHFLGIDPIPGSPDDPAMAVPGGSTTSTPTPKKKPKKPKPKKPPKPSEEMVAVPKHILSPEELEDVVTTLVQELGLKIERRITGAEALNYYVDLKNSAKIEDDIEHLMVSDSYFRNPDSKLPNVIEMIETSSRKIVNRGEWKQIAQGRQEYRPRVPDEKLKVMQGQKGGRKQVRFKSKPSVGDKWGKPVKSNRSNLTTNQSIQQLTPAQARKREKSKKSRYGGPEARVVRYEQEATKTYDELAVYVHAELATSKFTKKKRKYGGNVKYYFFKIIPKETKIPKSQWEKKYGEKK
tara:strand:- start:15248 stop:16624 length:1377 start_codon:yes stop_codon:yes gene_type:complete